MYEKCLVCFLLWGIGNVKYLKSNKRIFIKVKIKWRDTKTSCSIVTFLSDYSDIFLPIHQKCSWEIQPKFEQILWLSNEPSPYSLILLALVFPALMVHWSFTCDWIGAKFRANFIRAHPRWGWISLMLYKRALDSKIDVARWFIWTARWGLKVLSFSYVVFGVTAFETF